MAALEGISGQEIPARGRASSVGMATRCGGQDGLAAGAWVARAVTKLFRVSVWYIYEALIRRRSTGDVGASTRCGHRPRKLSQVQQAAPSAQIESQTHRFVA
jgi:hypothetical protein